jgi:hypothetical protein
VKSGKPKDEKPQGLEGSLERSERNPFAAAGPIWAQEKPPASKTARRSGAGFAHTLALLGLLIFFLGLALPWSAPAKYGSPVALVQQGLLLDLLRDGLYIFRVVYLDIPSVSLAGGLLVFLLLLIVLNRVMNIPVLTFFAGLLVTLLLLAAALGLVFLFARQQFLDAPLAGEPVTIGLYLWFIGLGLLLLGLAAEYLAHLRQVGPAGPSGLGRVL